MIITAGNGGRGLPRPPFDDPVRSGKRLIEWAEPLLSGNETARSKEAAMEFALGTGQVLQKELDRIRNDEGDHILARLVPYWEGWYLSSRDPLPVHSNPFYLFASDSLPLGSCPYRLAARLALSAAAFCMEIDRGTIEPDTFKGEPLCMNEYAKLFRTSRMAFPGTDRQVTGSKTGPAGRSVLVLSGGVPFLLELYSEDGSLRDVEETARHLREIAACSRGDSLPVGLITSLPRDQAAHGRRLLLEGGKDNERLLSLVEESLFVLRLDGPCGARLEEQARHFLFEGGGNGWYEKSFQLVVTEDGYAGVNFEHASRDGTHVGRLVKEILSRAPSVGGCASGLPGPVRLQFALSPKFRDFLSGIPEKAGALSGSRIQTVLSFDAFGTDAVKAGNTSPDAFMQTAMLMAARDLWGERRSVYESVHLRRFAGGRTEGTRPLTKEAAAFIDGFRSGLSSDTLKKMLFESQGVHKERIRECLEGRGIEGHLWLLRGVWRERGRELGLKEEPALYCSPAWKKMSSCPVSSSTTPGEGFALAGYGPVQPGGLGVRYLSRKDHFIIHVSSWKQDGALAAEYASFLEKALSDMGRLLPIKGNR
ncbi:MAG: choline/carnitine O-acyltransferase [Synergistaceae bacterium]|nr:choline/carnitine O-acyltransferase [Synergistaceae bacterium]